MIWTFSNSNVVELLDLFGVLYVSSSVLDDYCSRYSVVHLPFCAVPCVAIVVTDPVNGAGIEIGRVRLSRPFPVITFQLTDFCMCTSHDHSSPGTETIVDQRSKIKAKCPCK